MRSYRPGTSGINPTLERTAAGSLDASVPSTFTEPEVGTSTPAMQRSAVVLQAPLRPSRTRHRPSSTLTDRSCSASTSPYRLASPSTSSIGTDSEGRIRRQLLLRRWESCLGHRIKTPDRPPPRVSDQDGGEQEGGRTHEENAQQRKADRVRGQRANGAGVSRDYDREHARQSLEAVTHRAQPSRTCRVDAKRLERT